MSEDESNYDVLGVEPSATKDEVREAYRERLAEAQAEVTNAETAKRPEGSRIAAARADEARVRSAWQVLSDPVQRERHDESIGVEHDPAVDVDDDLDDDDDESAALTPREQRAAARRQAAATTRDGRPRPPGMFSTEHPDPPASWPPGLRPPPPRARVLALGVDLLVVLLIAIACTIVLPGVVLEQLYPKEIAKVDRVTECIDRLETANDSLDAKAATRARTINRANTECAKLETEYSTAKADKLYGDALSTEAKDKRLENQIDNRIGRLEDEQAEIRTQTLPGVFGLAFFGMVLALLYLIPSTLRSGRTLGKRLLQIRLVRTDGAPPDFRAAMLHYGAPIAVAFIFGVFLGQVAWIVALFGVLMWPRNANYQGLHDRLAGTLVVDG